MEFGHRPLQGLTKDDLKFAYFIVTETALSQQLGNRKVEIESKPRLLKFWNKERAIDVLERISDLNHSLKDNWSTFAVLVYKGHVIAQSGCFYAMEHFFNMMKQKSSED